MRVLLLAVLVLFLVTPALNAEKKRPRITTSVLCGVVTDLAGTPIPKASVGAMWADFGTGQYTDESGRWSFGAGTGPHWMEVKADGFETFIFDYVDGADPTDDGADKPGFIVLPKDRGCPAPIYVRLAPTNSKAGFVTLDPAKRILKEKKAQ